jgi:hypothetical protein
MSGNIYHHNVLRGLRNLIKIERDKAKRAYLNSLVDDQLAGNDLNEERIAAAKMLGVRNPAFDGDYVGYPDDDFDEDEDEDNPKK